MQEARSLNFRVHPGGRAKSRGGSVISRLIALWRTVIVKKFLMATTSLVLIEGGRTRQ
jgi:hypothetical protein